MIPAQLLGSRFLRSEDYRLPAVQFLQGTLTTLYRERMRGQPHYSGARRPDDVLIHWSRDWEYPWALFNYAAWRRTAAAAPPRGHGGFSWLRLADLGCGGSPLPFYLAGFAEVACMIGLDRQPVVADEDPNGTLRRYGHGVALPSKFSLCRADFSRGLPFLSESLDGVFCISVLEECPADWSIILPEIERVLRPGGIALLTVDIGRERSDSGDVAEAVAALIQGRIGLRRLVPVAFPGNGPLQPVDVAELPGTYQVLGLCMLKDKKERP